MGTSASTKVENKIKMADSRFDISNQSNVEQLRENSKNRNTLKATQTWLKVWHNWATKRKVNRKIEECKQEELDKMLQVFYDASMLHCWEYNKQKSHELDFLYKAGVSLMAGHREKSSITDFKNF